MRHVLAILTGSLLWGLAWLPIRSLTSLGLGPVSLTLAANGVAALVVLPAVVWRGGCRGRQLHTLLAIGLSGAAWNLCYMAAMAGGEAGRLMLLYYLSTVWAILGGRVFLGERLDRRRWLSLALAVGGAWLVLAVVSPAGREPNATADLLAVGAGLAHAITNLLFRRAHASSLAEKNGAMFTGAAIASAILLLGQPAPEVAPGIGAWVAGAAFGLGWLLLADTLTQYGVSQLPAARSSVLLIVELPVAVVSAALLAGERLSGWELGGGALIAMATLNELLPASAGRPQQQPATTVPQPAIPETGGAAA